MRAVPPKIIFINRYFHPDKSATSQILSDLAFHLAANGHRIEVITSRLSYDRTAAALPATETVAGVDIHRVSTTDFDRYGIAGRALDYLSFHLRAARRLAAIAAPGDVVVAKTDPPLLSVLAHRARRRMGLRTVNWLQDVYPEIAAALRVPLVKGRVLARLKAMRDASLRDADANVVLGRSMADYIRSCGVTDELIHIIPNWIDDQKVVPVDRDNPLRAEWGLRDRFVVAYSGNLGRAHDYETIVGAAQRLRDQAGRIVFLVVGDGRNVASLKRRAADLGVAHLFQFRPYQQQADLTASLGVADVHWLSLKPEAEGLIFPSKFYGIAAAGRAMIAIVDPKSEVADLIRRNDCGYAVTPGDAGEMARVIDLLSREPSLLATKGANARAMIERDYTRRQALDRWSELLGAVARATPGPDAEPATAVTALATGSAG